MNWCNQFIQLRLLILGQGFSRKEVECPGLVVGEQGLQGGEVITEGLSRSRGGYHHHMPALPDLFPDRALVGIDPGDPPDLQIPDYPGIKILRKRRIDSFLCRKEPFLNDIYGKGWVPQYPFQSPYLRIISMGMFHSYRI
jgi:hypothetical protein